MTTKISYAIALILGLAMIFLGVRFFTNPDAATAAFGIKFNAQGDYSFHYIKGIRDVFSGLLICAFVLMKERRALGVTLLAGTMIPLNDLLIVINKPYTGIGEAMSHSIAAAVCAIFGMILLIAKPKQQ